jgi:hypothetical protein
MEAAEALTRLAARETTQALSQRSPGVSVEEYISRGLSPKRKP